VAVKIDRDRVRGMVNGKPDLEPERVYARYSLDTLAWSSWQEIPKAKGPAAERWTHVGRLSVARPDREAFLAAVYRDARAREGGIDAAATLADLLEADPRYLERGIPGIGYVQLLHESSYHGGQRFRRIDASLHYVIPGPVLPPNDGETYWSFRREMRVEDGLPVIPAGTNAEELDFSGTGLTDEGLLPLRELPRLRRLDLRGTKVTDEAVAALKAWAEERGRRLEIRR
jgi:hypothetical protein